jgi:hypothetical protein
MVENNQFQAGFQKSYGDTGANGMGLEQTDMTGWTGEGSQPSELSKARSREQARYNDLNAKVLGKSVMITNEGIVLDSFGGAFGEGGTKPNIQGGANK